MLKHIVIGLMAALVLSTCVADDTLSEEEAIRIALEQASVARPEIGPAQEEPRRVHAEQMTYAEAAERLTGSSTVGRGEDPNKTVWLVTMEGLWLDEFPRPTGVPTPEPFHHYAFVIDACTGEVLMTAASR